MRANHDNKGDYENKMRTIMRTIIRTMRTIAIMSVSKKNSQTKSVKL